MTKFKEEWEQLWSNKSQDFIIDIDLKYGSIVLNSRFVIFILTKSDKKVS